MTPAEVSALLDDIDRWAADFAESPWADAETAQALRHLVQALDAVVGTVRPAWWSGELVAAVIAPHVAAAHAALLEES